MIQITKEMRKQLKREQERQARIEKCLSYFKVCTVPAMTVSGYQTYCVVASTSVNDRRYIVYVNDSDRIPTPTHCNCDATVENCIHKQAVTQYYERIAAIFARNQEETVEPAEVEQPVAIEEPVYVNLLANYDILANAETVRVDAFLALAYEELAPTKHVEHANHCPHCGNLCRGDICGYCAI